MALNRLTRSLSLLALAAASSGANALPVVNPGFETGNFSGWTTYRPGNFPPPANIGVNLTAYPSYAGTYQADFGDYDNGSGIEQALTTVVNQSYSVKFWVALDPGWSIPGDTLAFAFFGSSTVFAQASDPGVGTGFGWTQYGGNAVATSTSTNLRFFFENLPGYYHLDNISVTAVPEPNSWVLMISGFGMIGAAARRQRLRSAA